MKRTLTTTIATVLSVGCAIAEEKQPASLKKTKTYAELNEGTKPEDKKTNSVKAKPTQKVGKQTLVTRTYRVDSKKFLNSLKKQKSIDINPMKAKDDLIAEIKDEAKGNTYAEYKSDFAAIDAFSSDGMAEMFYDEVRKVFKSKLDGCRISAIINDGYKNIGKVAVSSNYSYKQKGKEKASTIAKVENHLAKAQSEAEAFFQSINLDD